MPKNFSERRIYLKIVPKLEHGSQWKSFRGVSLIMRESEGNAAIRHVVLFVSYFSMFFGIVLFLLIIVHISMYFSLIGIIPFCIGYYFVNRIYQIVDIADSYIKLKKGEKELILPSNIVISATKIIRFTLTDRFWLMITYLKNSNQKKERCFFLNEPEYDFVFKLSEIGITMKNMP